MKSLLYILGLFTFISCSSPSAEAPEEKMENETSQYINEEGVVQTNDGAKWTANKETNDGIQKMKGQIYAFNDLGLGVDSLNYNDLSRGLHNTLKGIFEQCNMTGPAHDELHDYLLPLLGNIRKLGNVSGNEAQALLDEIENHLNTYEQYFE